MMACEGYSCPAFNFESITMIVISAGFVILLICLFAYLHHRWEIHKFKKIAPKEVLKRF